MFELANGHELKIAAADWQWLTVEDIVSGNSIEPYLSICVYSNADTWPTRMADLEEFCAGTDFSRRDFEEIWSWLVEFCASRAVYEFDDVSEFIDFLADEISQRATTTGDAVEHYRQLPHVCQPEAFDKVDDSIYNDQNELEQPSP